MAGLVYQRTILGYHGCDRRTAEQVLLGRTGLTPSQNDYDWLGGGIYFWEFGPERALDWAQEIARRRPDRIREPAVLGAIIHLGICFDLLDVRFTNYLAEAYPAFLDFMQKQGLPIPVNEGLGEGRTELVLRKRDCAMLNWAIPLAESQRKDRFHTVRGVFQEGDLAFEGSAIRRKSHIQVVVRDDTCILGYFRPQA